MQPAQGAKSRVPPQEACPLCARLPRHFNTDTCEFPIQVQVQVEKRPSKPRVMWRARGRGERTGGESRWTGKGVRTGLVCNGEQLSLWTGLRSRALWARAAHWCRTHTWLHLVWSPPSIFSPELWIWDKSQVSGENPRETVGRSGKLGTPSFPLPGKTSSHCPT